MFKSGRAETISDSQISNKEFVAGSMFMLQVTHR